VIKKHLISLIFSVCLFAFNIAYGAQIVCDTNVSNSQSQLLIESNDDIYAVSKIDLPGGFRLAGQYLPSLAKFKLYIYVNSKDRYVLLSAQEFIIDPKACSRSFGDNLVYGEPYERDLFFQCRQICKD
jgi:hypothetical protein